MTFAPAPEVERAIAGAMLLADSLDEAQDLARQTEGLGRDHFQRREHYLVLEVSRELIAAGQIPDLVSVAAHLAARTKRGHAGAFVGALLDGLPKLRNVEAWAAQLRNGGVASHVLVKASTVVPEPVEWLWQHRVPRAKITVLDGDPGLGKSTMTVDVAARVSRGRSLPGDERPRAAAGVVLLSAEDGLADTIRPRLEAVDADLERVAVLTAVRAPDGALRPPSLPGDLGAVRAAIREMGAALVVVDPLMAFLGGKVDAHRDQDVRGALHLPKDLAEETRAAIVLVRHLNKTQGGHPIYRGGGSIGIIGAVRAGLLVAPDPDDADLRVLAVSKSNLGPVPPSLAYRIVPIGDTSGIVWEGQSEASARDLLEAQRDDPGGPRGKVDDAADWLRQLLAAGPVSVEEAKAAAKAAGYSWRGSIERARGRAGVEAVRAGGLGPAGRWYLSLREPKPPISRAPHTLAGVAGDRVLAGLSEKSREDGESRGRQEAVEPLSPLSPAVPHDGGVGGDLPDPASCPACGKDSCPGECS